MDARRRDSPSRNDNGGEVANVPDPQPHPHGLPNLQARYDTDYYNLTNPWAPLDDSNLNIGASMFPTMAPTAPPPSAGPPGFRSGDMDASIRNFAPQDTVAPFQILRTGRDDMDLHFPIYYGNLDVSSFRTFNKDDMDRAQLVYEPTSPASTSFPTSESSATYSSGDSGDEIFGYSFNSTLQPATFSSGAFKVENTSPSPVPGLNDSFASSWDSTTSVNPVASTENTTVRAKADRLPTRRRATRPRRVAKTSHYAEDPEYEEPTEDKQSSTAPTSTTSQSPTASNDHSNEEDGANTAIDMEPPTHRLEDETDSEYLNRRNQYLLAMRELKIPYGIIKQRGGFGEAESTLRGRCRTLSKEKSARVRQPVWTTEDVKLLRAAVREHRKNGLKKGGKLPWKQIGLWIHEHGGSYCFAPATCSKKWAELKGRE